MQSTGADVGAPEVWWGVRPSENRRSRSTHLIGRLKPGVTLAQAQADARAVARAVARERTPGRAAEPVVTRLPDHVSGSFRRPLLFLLGAVGLVLLVACANVTALLLARQAWYVEALGIPCCTGGASRTATRQILRRS